MKRVDLPAHGITSSADKLLKEAGAPFRYNDLKFLQKHYNNYYLGLKTTTKETVTLSEPKEKIKLGKLLALAELHPEAELSVDVEVSSARDDWGNTHTTVTTNIRIDKTENKTKEPEKIEKKYYPVLEQIIKLAEEKK